MFNQMVEDLTPKLHSSETKQLTAESLCALDSSLRSLWDIYLATEDSSHWRHSGVRIPNTIIAVLADVCQAV